MTRENDDELLVLDDDELLTIKGACAFLGGEKPIDPATLYRGIAKGIYPAPVHPSPGISRIVKRQLSEARARILGRGEREVQP